MESQSIDAKELAQVTIQSVAIFSPLFYLLGQQYAAGYFGSLGCGWASNYLSFQDSLLIATPIAIAMIVGIALGANAAVSGESIGILLRKIMTLSGVLAIATLAIGYLSKINLIEILFLIMDVASIIAAGAFIVEAYLATKGRSSKPTAHIATYAVIFLIITYYCANSWGESWGKISSDSLAKFPTLLSKQTFNTGTRELLIARIDGKYLTLLTRNGEKRFTLINDLIGYEIK